MAYTDNKQYAEDTAAASGESLTMLGAVRNDTRASLVDATGDRSELQVNASGDLRVDGSAVTQPVSLAANQSVNTAQINGVAPTMGNGASGTGVQRVTIASDSTGQVALAAGSNIIGVVNVATRTTGGATTFTLISAASTNATSVKGSAGTIYGIQCSNTGAAVAFLKIYNKATAPTVGTDVAVKTLIIPAGGGITVPVGPAGIALGTGIAIAITGLATTADTTAVALSQVVVNIDYA